MLEERWVTARSPIWMQQEYPSKMEAIVDLSTGATFLRNLTDQVFVQLEQEANGHLYLSPVKDMLSRTICDEDQLLGFQAAAKVLENLGKKGTGRSVCTRRRRDRWIAKKKVHDGKNLCLDTSLHSGRIRDTDPSEHTGQVTTDHLQAGSTSPITDARQPLGSMLHFITDLVSSPVRCDEHVSHVTIGCRQSQEGRMLSIDGTAGRGTTPSGSAGDGIEGRGQRPAFIKRKCTGTASLGSRKNEQESTCGQGPTAECSDSREPHEGTLDSVHKGTPDAGVDTSGFGLSWIRQAWSQDVSGGLEVGFRILPMDGPSGGSTTPLEAQEVLFVAEDAECSPGTEHGKQYDTGTPDETHQRTRGREIVRQQHWCLRSMFGNWWNMSSCWWSLRKSVEERDRQRILQDGRSPKEIHGGYYEFWRDGLDRRTSTTQSKSTTLKCSNDVGEEPWWIGLRLFACPLCPFRHFLKSDHYKPNIPEKTSASVKHILPNAERHWHTVLERRTRLGGYRIRLPASTFFFSLYRSQRINSYTVLSQIHPSSANMSHVSPLFVRGSEERRWKPEPTTMPQFEITPHGSEMLVQHSNRLRDLPLLADNNQMVFRKEWNEIRRDRGFFTIRCRIVLGPGTTRLTTLGNSGTRQGRAPCVPSPSQSADMPYCTIAAKTLRFEGVREDSCVAKQTVWPPYNTCLGK